jgi:four helix bundle protein
MSKVEKFEDLKCWQAARVLVREIFIACDQGKLSTDYDTRSQIKKASLSAMNNIAEGFGRYSKKDFVKFLNVAQSSVLEVESMLYVLSDLRYLTAIEIDRIRTHALDTRKLTLGLIRYVKNTLG